MSQEDVENRSPSGPSPSARGAALPPLIRNNRYQALRIPVDACAAAAAIAVAVAGGDGDGDRGGFVFGLVVVFVFESLLRANTLETARPGALRGGACS